MPEQLEHRQLVDLGRGEVVGMICAATMENGCLCLHLSPPERWKAGMVVLVSPGTFLRLGLGTVFAQICPTDARHREKQPGSH